MTTGTIQQTVASSGTIEPASQASLNFAVSGTVTAVNVKAGQTVTAGQVLATVDTTALSEDVSAAQAQLAAAEDRLASDEAGGGATTPGRLGPGGGDLGRVIALHTPRRTLNDASLTSTISGTVASVGPHRRPAGDGDRVGWRRRRARWHRRRRRAARPAAEQADGLVDRTDRGDRHRLLHREHDGGRHRDRSDRRRRPGRHRPDRIDDDGLRHGRAPSA